MSGLLRHCTHFRDPINRYFRSLLTPPVIRIDCWQHRDEHRELARFISDRRKTGSSQTASHDGNDLGEVDLRLRRTRRRLPARPDKIVFPNRDHR